MNKYNVDQFAKVQDDWYKIITYRFGMSNGKVDYLLRNQNKEGWIAEDLIEEVTKEDYEPGYDVLKKKAYIFDELVKKHNDYANGGTEKEIAEFFHEFRRTVIQCHLKLKDE